MIIPWVEVGQKLVIPAYSKISVLPQPCKQDSDEELEYADATSGVVESPCKSTCYCMSINETLTDVLLLRAPLWLICSP